MYFRGYLSGGFFIIQVPLVTADGLDQMVKSTDMHMNRNMDLSKFVPLTHQAAGHPDLFESEDSALFAKLTNRKEIDFYTKLNSHVAEDKPLGSSLIDWVPQFMGVLTPGISPDLKSQGAPVAAELEKKASEQPNSEKEYVLLENLLFGFSQPSVLDIKLGVKLYDDDATDDKKERLGKVSDSTTSGSLGFRICGMDIRKTGKEVHEKWTDYVTTYQDADKIEYIKFDKWFGRALDEDTVLEGLDLFFHHNELPEELRNIILSNTETRLQLLYNCLLEEEVRVISGSLLIIFENDSARWKKKDNQDSLVFQREIYDDDQDEEDQNDPDDENLLRENCPLSKLALVDFAHSTFVPGQKYDENLVDGLESLLQQISHLKDNEHR
ncbi:BA75_00770T0 [Komagataella pastoris]|uniref:Kinase n=1 Tax=Komagataella pastoris TaxID=4922 RepID=A0A1B2J8Y8_PICPA|nr:BA75_00770T0 [Komagataella pastoris]